MRTSALPWQTPGLAHRDGELTPPYSTGKIGLNISAKFFRFGRT
jgi:hypothetical protein